MNKSNTRAPYGSLENQRKNSKKISLKTKYYLALLVMVPVAIISLLIIGILKYLFKVDIQEHSDVILLTVVGGTVLLIVIGSVIWTDKEKLIKAFSKMKKEKQKLKLEKEQYKDSWE